MITENEKWRNGSDENQENAAEKGYGNKNYSRENRYNYEGDTSRSYRPNGYSRTTGGYNRMYRPQRPRFTRNVEEGG